MITWKRSRRAIARILLVIICLGLLPLQAWAQTEQLEFKNLSVTVMPEYDDPRVLVILEGTFVNKSTTPFSGEVKWNIPNQGEIEVGMACELDSSGGHSCLPYKENQKGEWIELTWKASKTIQPGEEYPVFLEYYYNPLEGSVEKQFSFPYQPSYEIKSLSVSVQQPLKASNFKITPAANSTSVDQSGFTTYNYSFNNQSVNDKRLFKITYTKSDPAPSVTKKTADEEDGAPASGGSASSNSANDINMTLLAAVLVVLLAFIVYAIILNNQQKQVIAKYERRSKRKKNERKER